MALGNILVIPVRKARRPVHARHKYEVDPPTERAPASGTAARPTLLKLNRPPQGSTPELFLFLSHVSQTILHEPRGCILLLKRATLIQPQVTQLNEGLGSES